MAKNKEEKLKKRSSTEKESIAALAEKTANAENGFSTLISQSIEETTKMGLVSHMEELRSTKSVTQLVDAVIKKAYESKASDIHIDPQPESVIIRFRIDGMLHDIASLNRETHPLIITRIKVLSGLRTDEHFIAQDGRFRLHQKDTDIDVRVSIIPTHYGENVVMRLLVGSAQVLGLGQLGFNEKDLKLYFVGDCMNLQINDGANNEAASASISPQICYSDYINIDKGSPLFEVKSSMSVIGSSTNFCVSIIFPSRSNNSRFIFLSTTNIM